MSTKKQIAEIIELLESTGISIPDVKRGPYTIPMTDALVTGILDRRFITYLNERHHPILEDTLVINKEPFKPETNLVNDTILAKSVARHTEELFEVYQIKLQDLSSDDLKSLKQSLHAVVSHLNQKKFGLCARNQVAYYLNNLNKEISGFTPADAGVLMGQLNSLSLHAQNGDQEAQRDLAQAIAKTASQFSSSKHKHRLLGVLIIAAIVITSPFLFPVYCGLFANGNKNKLSTGEKIINSIADNFAHASKLSKASKALTLFTQQAQQPADGNEPALNPNGLKKVK